MIYADANGSLPLLPEVRAYLSDRIPAPLFGNPNAIHSLGTKLAAGLERSRAIAAEALGAKASQLSWCSGASEAISTVLQHHLLPPTDRRVIYASPIEHAAVLSALAYYQNTWGFELRWMPVSPSGLLDLPWLERQDFSSTALVVAMAANNETGVVQPWEGIRDLARAKAVPFLCDTTQIIGRVPFHFEDSGLDFAMASGHKLGALPGSGLLLARDPGALRPLIFGGGQEKGLRGGTQNYIGAETIAVALSGLNEKLARIPTLNQWRAELEAQLPASAVVIGRDHDRLPGTMLIGNPGLHGQAVQIELEAQNIFVTTSSACSDNEPATSKVLRAMGVDDRLGRSVIRASLPLSATHADYLALTRGITSAFLKLDHLRTSP